MLLLAASIAGGTPVSLNDTLPGIDQRNASLVINAIRRACGRPPGCQCALTTPLPGHQP